MSLSAIVDSKIRYKRRTICQDCKWYNRVTDSCGTLFVARFTDGKKGEKVVTKIKENRVTHYKKPIYLCGCKISEKIKYAWSKCPADKWGTERLNEDELIQLRTMAVNMKSKPSVHSDELKPFYTLLSKFTGQNITGTTCASCVREMIDFAINQTREYEVNP